MLLGSSLVYTHAHNSLIHDQKNKQKQFCHCFLTLMSFEICMTHFLLSMAKVLIVLIVAGVFFQVLYDSLMMFSYCHWMAEINSWHSFCASWEKKHFCFFFLFNSNRITRDGAKCLSEVLKQSRSLEILDLSSNRIEDDGAVYLSEAIKLPHSKLKA